MQGLAPHLLGLKLEHLLAQVRAKGQQGEECSGPYSLGETLVKGTIATIFDGAWRRGRGSSVTILVRWCWDSASPASKNLKAEVMRYAACAGVPQIHRPVDVAVFPDRDFAVGLVFEKYDASLNELLERKVPFRTGGCRHILDSVLRALLHLHSLGIVHTGLQPSSVLLRGAARYKEHFLRKFQSGGHHDELNQPNPAEPLEVTYELPAFFEVRRHIGNERFSASFFLSFRGARGRGREI